MRTYTKQELEAIAYFLDECEEGMKSDRQGFIKIYQDYQRQLLKLYKKFPKET